MRSRRYNRQEWPLTVCAACATLRYCEPHGTTADCPQCARWTESVPIPYTYGDLVVSLTARDRKSIAEKGA